MKYRSIRDTEAEPMTRGEAVKEKLIGAGGDPEEGGYKVTQGGHSVWYPENVFYTGFCSTEHETGRLDMAQSVMGSLLDHYEKETAKPECPYTEKERVLISTMLNLFGQAVQLIEMRCISLSVEEVPIEGMSFAQIMHMINIGCVVRRKAWRERHLMVIGQVPADISPETIPQMTSLPPSGREAILHEGGRLSYRNQCLLYNTMAGVATGWYPTIEDIFSSDWELVDYVQKGDKV